MRIHDFCYYINSTPSKETLSCGKIEEILETSEGKSYSVDGNDANDVFKTFDSAIKWWYEFGFTNTIHVSMDAVEMRFTPKPRRGGK